MAGARKYYVVQTKGHIYILSDIDFEVRFKHNFYDVVYITTDKYDAVRYVIQNYACVHLRSIFTDSLVS